jgi:TRAP-type C4-dicarboxylate transport system permease small subunit
VGCAAITVDIILQVFFRYILNKPLRWSEEAGIYLMIWMIFLAASLLTRDSEYISISIVVRSLPDKAKAVLSAISHLIIIIFLVFFTYYGFQVFQSGLNANSPALGISTKWIKLAIPFGAILMIIHSISLLVRKVKYLLQQGESRLT